MNDRVESEMAEEIKGKGVSLNQIVYDRKGEPVMYIGKNPATLRDLLLVALDGYRQGEDPDSKAKAYAFGNKLFKAAESIKLTAPDKAYLMERVRTVIAPALICGRVCDLLDPDGVED